MGKACTEFLSCHRGGNDAFSFFCWGSQLILLRMAHQSGQVNKKWTFPSCSLSTLVNERGLIQEKWDYSTSSAAVPGVNGDSTPFWSPDSAPPFIAGMECGQQSPHLNMLQQATLLLLMYKKASFCVYINNSQKHLPPSVTFLTRRNNQKALTFK